MAVSADKTGEVTFESVLFQGPGACEQLSAPGFFVNLNLNQIAAAITAGKEEYNLKAFFYAPLHDADAIVFRHEVMQDLEDGSLCESITAFARKMHVVRQHFSTAEKLRYLLQKQRWYLNAVEIYCDAVTGLMHDLSAGGPKSRGLLAFREYIIQYAASNHFTSLAAQTKRLTDDLSDIRYTILINGSTVEARRYKGEANYSAEVGATFERFKQGAVKEHTFQFINSLDMNHVEAEILVLVTRLYPDIFAALEAFCLANKDFQDSTVVRFDREIQFYVAYLEHIARLKQAGMNFCYPYIVRESKEICSEESFDLALANKLLREHAPVVCNDFYLTGRERIIVVSGPNQGGKTTFARAFGQLHYLASLGCPVPGKRAQLFLFDELLTHFEREENINDPRGKLQDDLVRIHQILERATPNSIVILNEVFTSTTLSDAVLLSEKIVAKLMELDLLCVWVTFVDELSSLGEQTVSMTSTVVPDNPALRTFKIVRRPADGLAYAMAIAEKHRLSYQMIKERVSS